MIFRKATAALCAVALGTLLVPAAAAAEATPSPAWRIDSLALPTVFVPDDEAGEYGYEVRAVDITGAPLSPGLVTLTDTLPAGLGVKSIELKVPEAGVSGFVDVSPTCEAEESAPEVQTVTCEVPGKFGGKALSREALKLVIKVKTPASATGPLENAATIAGAGAGSASTVSDNEAGADPAPSGFAYFDTEVNGPDGAPTAQAGSHPYQYVTSFALNTELEATGKRPIPAEGDLRDVHVALPPGLVGNPNAVARCSQQQFAEVETGNATNACSPGSVVGTIDTFAEGSRRMFPLYSLVPPAGMPAQLGFQSGSIPFYIDTVVGPGPEFPIISTVRNTTEIERPIAARVVIWGVPGEANHDRQRGGFCLGVQGGSLGSCPAGEEAMPFLRLPTGCESPLSTRMLFNTWDNPLSFIESTATLGAPEGCAVLGFNPSFAAQPQNKVADSPTGLHVGLRFPQNEDPDLNGSADLREVTVTLPEGLVVNPPSAAGLAGCTPSQIGLGSSEPADCPDAAKVGTVQAKTPLLDHPVSGSVYVASQVENPFHSLIALYIVLDDPQTGTVVKLPGEVNPDPVTGRITSIFESLPQFPLDEATFDFFNGPRAPLRTPGRCGAYATSADLKPWSAPDSGPDAVRGDSFEVAGGPTGSCPSGALAASLSAGTRSPIAGSYTPFSLRLSREDGTGELNGLNVSTPAGLTAKLAGIPYCPEAGIAQAKARGNPGDGAAEQASPSCPAASQVGTLDTAAGAGTAPLHTPGKLYLAGPYKSAPLSLVAIVPAVAGPFDLGVVVDRIAIDLDPATAQVSAQADPFPSILAGIPLDVREVKADLDRPNFTLAPTSCEPKAIAAMAFGVKGGSVALSDRFQLGACAALGFKPRLSLKLKGGTKRGGHPALTGTYRPKEGDANLEGLVLRLPHSAFLDQAHIKTICTRVQYASGAGNGAGCPAASVYGQATAYTPLLDKPLEGPVYLRSSSHNLPDLVFSLHGQVDVEAVARIDSKKGGIRTSFTNVPDAPLSKVVVQMQGGAKGLIVNSRGLCKAPSKANAAFSAHNGRRFEAGPAMQAQCGGGRHGKRGRGGR